MVKAGSESDKLADPGRCGENFTWLKTRNAVYVTIVSSRAHMQTESALWIRTGERQLVQPPETNHTRTYTSTNHVWCFCCAQSHIIISSRLSCTTSVNKAADALYRHPLLVQMSVSVQSAVTITVRKRWFSIQEREALRIIIIVFFVPRLQGVCVLRT